jgi:multiple sugar transport system substrate-binding protein
VAGQTPTLSRRQLLQSAAAGGVVLAGSVLTGCSTGSSKPSPTAQSPRILLVMQADTDSLPTGTTLMTLLQEVVGGFTAQNKGIDIKVQFMPGYQSNVTELLAGTGPDIIADWYAPPYWNSKLLLPLDELIKRDNVDVSVWSPGQMTAMREGSATMSLPAYFSPMVLAVRVSDWDSAGYERPNPAWDYNEFVTECKRMTTHTVTKNRFGCAFAFHASAINGSSWIFQAFGGDMLNPAHTQEQLNTPACLQAGQWMYEQLFWPGYATSRNAMLGGPTGSPQFLTDNVSMITVWDGIILELAAGIRDSFPWQIYPYPKFPAGVMCQGTEDFYAISARTKHVEQSWELIKWLSYEKTWQQAMMKIGAMPPARNDLWDQWISTVQTVAPPLKNVNLHYLRDLAVSGAARPGEYYAVQDQQMRQLVSPWFTKLWNEVTTVPEAFQECDHIVNAAMTSALKQQS